MTHYRAHLQLHCAALLVGVSALFGKSLNVSASLIVFGRAAFALLALSLLCSLLKSSPWRRLSAATIGQLMLTGAALGGHWWVFFMAVQTGGVAVATLGFASFPAFTALLEWLLFKQRPGRSEALILLLVSAGLVLVTPSFDPGNDTTAGLLWGIFSGASYAAIALVNKRFSSQVDGLSSCWWQCLAISLLLLPTCWQHLPEVSGIDWLQLAALGILCTGLAYTLFIAALRHVPTNTAAVVIAMEPVYAIAGAWLVFASIPTLSMLLGGVLIITATLCAGLRSKG